jgi:hypothetical protein
MANDLADYGVPVSIVTIDVKRILDHDFNGAIMLRHTTSATQHSQGMA